MYPLISYSIQDTTISITLGSCFEVNKYRQSQKISRFRLDRIGRNRRMQSTREEQKEALETLVEFNERLLKNMKIIVKELSGARLDDTDIFLADILKAINWEIQVTNRTIELLNEKEQNIDKDTFNQAIIQLNTAVKDNDDAKMAAAFQGVIPLFEQLEVAAKKVIM